MEIRRVKCGPELLLCAIGDIQYSAHTERKRLKQLIKWGAKNKAHFLGMGDYNDFLSPSNREKLANIALYDSAIETIDDAARHLVEELALDLQPSKGHWDGLLEGHHFYGFSDKQTSDQYLSELLEGEFLGTAVSIIYEFPNGAECTVFAHHGAGSSIMLAGVLNRLEKIMRDHDADIYLMGHQHRLGFWRAVKLGPVRINDEDVLQERHVILGATGSYLKGYEQGAMTAGRLGGPYPERRLLPPLALGSGAIRVTPIKQGDHYELDFQCDDNPLYPRRRR